MNILVISWCTCRIVSIENISGSGSVRSWVCAWCYIWWCRNIFQNDFFPLCTFSSSTPVGTQKIPSCSRIHSAVLILWTYSDPKSFFFLMPYLLHMNGIFLPESQITLLEISFFVCRWRPQQLWAGEVSSLSMIHLILRKSIIQLAAIKSSLVPKFNLISLVFVKKWEGCEILPDLQNNEILYHSFMDAGRRHENLGS